MIDAPSRRLIAGQALFTLLALAILLARLVALSPGAVNIPGPDLLLALTLVWVLRRPEHVPVLLIAVVFLIEGLLTQRPPGLWAAVVVVVTEAARFRGPRWREQTFLVEWVKVALLIVGMVLANRLVESAFLVPDTMSARPPLGQVLMQVIATVACYPLLTWAGALMGGLRRAAGEADR